MGKFISLRYVDELLVYSSC